MRYLSSFFIALLCLTGTAAAATESRIDWGVNTFTVQNKSYNSIKLDVAFTQRYIRTNGVLGSSAPQTAGTPVTGTCVETPAKRFVCQLFFDQSLAEIDIDGTLNGNLTIKDRDGAVIVTRPLFYTGIVQQ